MKHRSAIQLLKKYLSGIASAEETARVDKWYRETQKTLDDEDQDINSADEIKQRIYNNILSVIEQESKPVPFYRNIFFRFTAVAAAIVLFGVSLYFLWPSSIKQQNKTVATKPVLKNDVAPPLNNKAVLTLGDGTKINIDSAGNGVFAKQGSVNVIKQKDGQIVYKGNANTVTYNTITVPKGSKPLRLNLADGSEVWLNVASSIVYPTAFTGHERKVVITGEAYFEIAKNVAKPFIVQQANSDMQVRVLGTHFNVNTYDDEFAIKVTLLEGALDVSKSNDHVMLSPGQQAQVYVSTIRKSNDVDLNEVMSWKNGTFYFDGADIKTIMRQVEKWYDVDVEYKDDVRYSFVANISRDVNASQLFKILELTNLVHFKIEGNKITVMK